jgi:site-specific recombinase XerD
MFSYLSEFQRFLDHSEHSPLTIKGYLADLTAFATWFQHTNGDPLAPEKITATDLREYKRWLVLQRQFRPNTVNRKLATLRAFLKWSQGAIAAETIAPGQVPAPERQIRLGPRWLDRREQKALLRAVEGRHRPRDLAIVQVAPQHRPAGPGAL